MLPRAALHQENVISNEQVKRQRVEAGQIARSAHGLPLPVLLSLRIHYCNNYASLHIRRCFCEVACFSVK